MPVSIYQVNLSVFSEETFAEIIDSIIARAEQSGNIFKPDKLSRAYDKRYPVHIFYEKRRQPPKWAGFLENILDKNAVLVRCKNLSHSFLCFIEYEENLFALCGGAGNFVIQPYISDDFGLEILSRLIDRDSKVIKSIQDRGVTGIVLGQMKFYRGDQRLTDEDQFGKIYKQVEAELDVPILTKIFGFNEADLRRNFSGCLAKSSFQIKKAIDFDELLRLLGRFTQILRTEKKFSLNKVIQISKRKPEGQLLIEQLDECMIRHFFNRINEGDVPDFDVCHKSFEAYRLAAEYELILNREDRVTEHSPWTLHRLVECLRDKGALYQHDFTFFKNALGIYQIIARDEEGSDLTSGSILQHLHGEIEYNGRAYFFLDGLWYQVDPDFIADLNSECAAVLRSAWETSVLPKLIQIGRSEKEYNRSYIGQPRTLVFDTITPENIEFCDVLRYTDDSVYLIHIKKGFDNSVRELAAQVENAAKRLRADIKSGYAYIEKVQSQVLRGRGSRDLFLDALSKQSFPTGGLETLFKTLADRQIVFCLAFADKASEARSLKDDLLRFGSNIAKLSLLELSMKINTMGFGFRVIQIPKA